LFDQDYLPVNYHTTRMFLKGKINSTQNTAVDRMPNRLPSIYDEKRWVENIVSLVTSRPSNKK